MAAPYVAKQHLASVVSQAATAATQSSDCSLPRLLTAFPHPLPAWNCLPHDQDLLYQPKPHNKQTNSHHLVQLFTPYNSANPLQRVDIKTDRLQSPTIPMPATCQLLQQSTYCQEWVFRHRLLAVCALLAPARWAWFLIQHKTFDG